MSELRSFAEILDELLETRRFLAAGEAKSFDEAAYLARVEDALRDDLVALYADKARDSERLDWMGESYGKFDHAIWRGDGFRSTTVSWIAFDSYGRDEDRKTTAIDFRTAIDQAMVESEVARTSDFDPDPLETVSVSSTEDPERKDG